MKYWKQLREDAFEYYGGFSKEKIEGEITAFPELSTFTINGTLVDKRDFITRCTNDIRSIFSRSLKLSGYKVYIIANVEIIDRNSRIERYKRVWKSLQNKWSLDTFRKGPEVELSVGDSAFYSSIAEFSLAQLPVALEIVANNPERFVIIASERENLLCEGSIKDICSIVFNTIDPAFPMIDYLKLCLHLCSKGDIVFRWGDSAEEVAVGLIFKTDCLEELCDNN